jgi:hypothetical protein
MDESVSPLESEDAAHYHHVQFPDGYVAEELDGESRIVAVAIDYST